MTRRTHPPLTDAQIAALRAFAKHEGRKWKDTLNMTYWYNARLWRDPFNYNSDVGSILHGLRNTHGPSWLDSFTFPME